MNQEKYQKMIDLKDETYKIFRDRMANYMKVAQNEYVFDGSRNGFVLSPNAKMMRLYFKKPPVIDETTFYEDGICLTFQNGYDDTNEDLGIDFEIGMLFGDNTEFKQYLENLEEKIRKSNQQKHKKFEDHFKGEMI